MNPETLLHTIAEQLRAEAVKGPGTMFLMHIKGSFYVTRTPDPAQIKSIVAKYDCLDFTVGLSVMQWSSLMRKIWSVHPAGQKGFTSEQQPAKTT